jgi:hypothetical protein
LGVAPSSEPTQVEVTLPKAMIDGIHGLVTDTSQSVTFEITSNTTSSTIRFTVPANASYMEIIGTTMVPEFPLPVLALPAGLAVVLLIVRTFGSRKYTLRNPFG